MTKISSFKNFEIVKMRQKGPFWRKPIWGQKTPVNSVVVWFFIFIFLPLK